MKVTLRLHCARRSLVLLTVAAACKGASPVGPDSEVPIYGACNVQPTYVSEVALNRWPSFPLTYFFDAASFPSEFLEEYESAIAAGIRRWDMATANQLGAVEEVEDRGTADFVITYDEVSTEPAIAFTVHSTGTPFLAGGEIHYVASGMREGEDLLREGRISRQTFLRVISSIAAHEMGHLMGIIGHSSREDVLMGPRLLDAPTTLDLNTLSRAYCHDKS
jgi:predicted Zn-dependent protease